MITLMAHDPGTTNYGYAIVRGEQRANGTVKFRVLENGLAPVTIKNLKDHRARRIEKNAYREWCDELVQKYQPQGIIAERYMTRGLSGPTIESVNMMLGVLQCYDLPDMFIPAATWKNGVTRTGIELKAEYKRVKTTPHQLDACLIGVYGLHKALKIQDFGTLSRKRWERLLDNVEQTSTARLINRKIGR